MVSHDVTGLEQGKCKALVDWDWLGGWPGGEDCMLGYS
jgi:hypothetical protein